MAAFGDEDVDDDDNHRKEQGGENARKRNPHDLGRRQGRASGLHKVDVGDAGTANGVAGRAVASAADIGVPRHAAGRRGGQGRIQS